MFLALKEMRRARLRFGLLAGAVGLLVFLILFQQSLLNSLITQFIGGLRNQSAEVLVYGVDARKNLEGSRVTPAQVEAVGQVPGVAKATGLGEGTFTVTAAGVLKDAVIFGYELGGPGAPTTLQSGRLPEKDGEALSSASKSEKGFGLGDQIQVAPAGVTMTIVGTAKDAKYSVAPTLYTSFATYESARRSVNPDAQVVLPSVVAVTVAPGASPTQVATAINAAVPGVEALSRADAVAATPGVSAITQSFGIILGLFYIIIPLVTGLFFLIITFQKASSLTLLRAIGARPQTLVWSLLIQVLIVVLGGAAFATFLLWGASFGTADIGVSVDPAAVATTTMVVLVLGLLAALAAVRRVLKLDPVSATTGQGVQV